MFSDWGVAAGVLIAVWFLMPSGVWAQSSARDTVEVTREVLMGNQSIKEARKQAIREAKAEAVRRVVGTEVQAERRSATVDRGEEIVDRFSQVVRTGASGRVVDSEVLSGDLTDRNGTYFYQLRLRAIVVAEKGRSDPSFQVSLSLNDADQVYVDRGRLEESDEIVATIETTKDAHLTLFGITPDTVEVIWPNSIAKEAFAPANTPVQFPPSELRSSRALRLRAEVPEGRNVVTRRLVAVATKENVPFTSVPDLGIQDGRLSAAQASAEAMNRWLVNIPLDQRAMATVTYEVKRTSNR